MTREDIVRIAQEAGIGNSSDLNWHDPTIERFAKLVAEAERKKLQRKLKPWVLCTNWQASNEMF